VALSTPLQSNAEVNERGAVPPNPFWAFMACSSATFTFTFYDKLLFHGRRTNKVHVTACVAIMATWLRWHYNVGRVSGKNGRFSFSNFMFRPSNIGLGGPQYQSGQFGYKSRVRRESNSVS
jgi:hypothetical protein